MSNPQYKHDIKQSAVLLWIRQPHGSGEGPDTVAKICHPLRVP